MTIAAALASRPGDFRPGEEWLDTAGVPINAHGGGILSHEGIFYWYGEHKIAGSAGNSAHVGVHVYRSVDLVAWEDAGIALAVSAEATHDLAAGCIIERPKVVFNAATGLFVMWFHWEPKGRGYSGSRSGVAVADTPTGPFHFLRTVRPNAGHWPENAPAEQCRILDPAEETALAALTLPGGPLPYYPKHLLFRRDFSIGQMARDMTVFVDDDGIAYHVYASEANGTLHIAELSADYIDHSGRFVRIFPGRFHEAPALFKHRGRYFLITSDCTGWAPNAARVSVAESIWGPWEELGNPCIGMGAQISVTFGAQPTFVLPLPGRPDAFIFLADRWCPGNAIDGRYVWLPIEFHHGIPMFAWHEQWHLSRFA